MINQVTLVGRLTKDPELKTTVEGTPVVQISLAVSRNFRNHNGEIETDFVSCTIWRKAAENTAHYCRKGSVVGVTGRLQTRHYEKEGKRVYVTEVIAEQIRFLSTKPHVENPSPSPSSNPRSTPSPEPSEKKEEIPVGT
ncbi:single-stranded DNA-binding protein [Bacillus xiapuensis]|uniref:Single-stranded DNA-binding protein n=1 Tax=Bacillus xiapuensis TaxID=2014075 RepID=A0ABU6N7E3_9BACI|nr:single-stranded DNA-binding protein [Bacillus xiapuensis]